MRIPSGLDDENLYRRRNQKSVQHATYRRLFRLVLGLVLVLVLMKQAGNPKAYRILFSEPPQRVLVSSTSTPKSSTALNDSDEVAGSPLAEDASQSARDRSDHEAAQLAKISEGATWKPQDRWVFYRLLEGTPLAILADKPPRGVGVISLLQQPDVYLRTTITIRGIVARITQQTAQANDFGIESYWEIWLQSLDGGKRPVAFYTHELPAELRSFTASEYVPQGPVIEVQGVYLKRLAYQSAAGSELAPAIVGRVHAIESDSFWASEDGVSPSEASGHETTSAAAAPSAAASDSNRGQPRLWSMVLAAAVLGIGTALLITMATAVSARRRRAARLASLHVSDQLLASLAANSQSREPA